MLDAMNVRFAALNLATPTPALGRHEPIAARSSSPSSWYVANRTIKRPVPMLKRPSRTGNAQRLVLIVAAAQATDRE